MYSVTFHYPFFHFHKIAPIKIHKVFPEYLIQFDFVKFHFDSWLFDYPFIMAKGSNTPLITEEKKLKKGISKISTKNLNLNKKFVIKKVFPVSIQKKTHKILWKSLFFLWDRKKVYFSKRIWSFKYNKS